MRRNVVFAYIRNKISSVLTRECRGDCVIQVLYILREDQGRSVRGLVGVHRVCVFSSFVPPPTAVRRRRRSRRSGSAGILVTAAQTSVAGRGPT